MSTEHALPGQLDLFPSPPLDLHAKRLVLYRAHLRAAHQPPSPRYPFPAPTYDHHHIPRTRTDLIALYDDLLSPTPQRKVPRWAVPVLKELGASQ